jgi:hypothetical protein
MPFDFTSFKFTSLDVAHADSQADAAAGYDDYGAAASASERVVTAVAVAMAILFVSAIAVLMGMA